MHRVMFLECPEYMNSDGTARCGLPAAVEYRYPVSSTDGPLESAKIRCPRGHCFNGPLESLTWEKDLSAAERSVPLVRPDRALRPFFRTGRGITRAPPAFPDQPALRAVALGVLRGGETHHGLPDRQP